MRHEIAQRSCGTIIPIYGNLERRREKNPGIGGALPRAGTMPTFISLEDHFASEATLAAPERLEPFAFHLWPEKLSQQLSSLGDIRIGDLDSGDIALQVVSALPITEPLKTCVLTNTQLARAVANSRGRLAAFASLPMADPTAAATELERCVRDSHFLGALIPNHAEGNYYDGDTYRPFWSAAEKLQIPIYLHPCTPHNTLQSIYPGNFSPEVTTILSQGGWGWHADVALHLLKLYASGLFDLYPKLKIVLGHAGEMLPYMVKRITGRISRGLPTLRRSFPTVWAENVWVTISGVWDLASFACLIRAVAADRILFSVDYPFESNQAGAQFMDELRHSGLVTPEQWDMVAFGNAEKLLDVTRPAFTNDQ